MPIDFPNNPTSGQTYSYGINRWIYNGVAWDKLDNHPGICGGNQISINYSEGLNGATFGVNVIEGHGSDLDADLLDGVSGERFIENLETGLLYGGILSINSGNTATFDITSGLAVFTTLNATTTSAPAPTVSYAQWTAKTGVTLAGLTSTDITFVSLNSSGQFLQSNTPFTNTQYETQVPIGALIHPSRTYISFAQSYPHVAYDQSSQSDIFIRSFGPLKISGHDITGYDATLQLSRASGAAYALGRNYSNDPNSPNLVSDTNANPASVIYRQYRGATAGTWNTVVNTAVDPHYYDDGSGTLASVPGGRYSIQRVFYFPNSPTVLLVYYGRATYNSIDTAKAALVFEQFSESTDTAESAIFCGYLIIKSGISNFSATSDYSIIQGGLFRSTVNVGGGGVAVANLDDLNDVTITSVANNQALAYDSSTGHWVNKSFTSLPVVTSFNGSTGAVTGVASFNGTTGTVVGVNSVRGLTGAVGITNGSGIGLSVSGQTMTFSNTGVLSINGSTGAITSVARTNATNVFGAAQTIQYTGGAGSAFLTLDDLNTANQIYFVPADKKIIAYEDLFGNQQALAFDTTTTGTVTLPSMTTTLAGLAVNQTFTDTNTFNVLTNFVGGISAAGGIFGSLVRFNSGISSAGGTFSSLARFTAGISAAGGTFSGTQTFVNGATFQGNIVAPNIVTSFNGSTGAVVGVSSVRGLTGAVGITNGSGIGLSVSGQTMTFSNTGVLSFNGLTGAVTGVTTGTANTFGPLQSFTNGISASGATLGCAIIRSGLCASSPLILQQNEPFTANNIVSNTLPIALFKVDSNHWILIDGLDTTIQNHLGTIGIGDSDGQQNSTSLQIYDGAQSVVFNNVISFTAASSGSGNVYPSSQAYFLYDRVTLGDPNSEVNGIFIAIDNNSGNIVYMGGYQEFHGTVDFSQSTVIGNIVNSIRGLTGAVGITNGSGIGLSVSGQTMTFSNTGVLSFNGLTGAVTGVTTGTANTFTALQTFNSGISAAGGATFAGTVASDTGYRITSNVINAQTGTTYTFLTTDNGKIVTFNNAATTTVTVPTGLPIGFNCTGIQLGAGQVGFTTASGVTLNAYSSAYKIAGQHGSASLISYATNIFNLSGSLNP